MRSVTATERQDPTLGIESTATKQQGSPESTWGKPLQKAARESSPWNTPSHTMLRTIQRESAFKRQKTSPQLAIEWPSQKTSQVASPPATSRTTVHALHHGSTATKRKASPDPTAEKPLKKASRKPPPSARKTSSLTRTLQQYGLLECIVSMLGPDDLLALALSSKAIYSALFPRAGSLENILGKLSCDGKGVMIRNKYHQMFPTLNDRRTKYVQCGTATDNRQVESRPCVRCKATTCNECRIHCVYQSTYEPPAEEDELAEFGGFILLEPAEHNILSRRHYLDFEPDDVIWENPATSARGPYHDIPGGFLDLPLDTVAYGPPEDLELILTENLGCCPPSHFSWSSTEENYPVLGSLLKIIEARKLNICTTCHLQAPKGPEALRPALPLLPWLESLQTPIGYLALCNCTLQKRIIDRWTCLRCYVGEVDTIAQATNSPCGETGLCRCGNEDATHTICLWCWGEVVELSKLRETIKST